MDIDDLRITVFVPDATTRGGSARRLVDLVRALRAAGGEAEVMAFEHGRVAQVCHELAVPVREVAGRSPLHGRRDARAGVRGVPACIRAIRDALARSEGPRVVIVRGPWGALLGAPAARMAGARALWDIDYVRSFRGAQRVACWLAILLTDGSIAQYREGPGELGRVLGGLAKWKGTRSVLPAVNPERIEALTREASGRRNEGPEEFRILIVGSLVRRKRQDVVLNAVRHLTLRPHIRKIVVDLVGSPLDFGYVADLERLADQMPAHVSVAFHGWRDDVGGFYEAADVLAMPSEDEGIPNVVQEARLLGVPVVAAAVGGLPELLSGQSDCVLVRRSSDAVWAEALEGLLSAGPGGRRRPLANGPSDTGEGDWMRWGGEYLEAVRGLTGQMPDPSRDGGATPSDLEVGPAH